MKFLPALIAALACLSCGGPISCLPTSNWVSVDMSKGCRELKFPGAWKLETGAGIPGYRIRKVRADDEDYLLVALATPYAVSENKYKLPLLRPESVSVAGDDEWRRGEEFEKSAIDIDWFVTAAGQRLDKAVARQRFQLTGRNYWGALDSPNGNRVAIRSVDGTLPQRKGAWFWNLERSAGDHFVEVFEASNGRRLLRLKGQFCQVDPYSIWTYPGGWIDDNTLLLTYFDSPSFGPVLCRLP